MPFFYWNKCNQCSFQIPFGLPEATYITTDSGERVECPHIGENPFIARMLNIGEKDAWNARYHASSLWLRIFRRRRHMKAIKLMASRTGKLTPCICDEFHEFDLDYTNDSHKCPICSSDKVIRVVDLEGMPCPKCQAGRVEKLFTGAIT